MRQVGSTNTAVMRIVLHVVAFIKGVSSATPVMGAATVIVFIMRAAPVVLCTRAPMRHVVGIAPLVTRAPVLVAALVLGITITQLVRRAPIVLVLYETLISL